MRDVIKMKFSKRTFIEAPFVDHQLQLCICSILDLFQQRQITIDIDIGCNNIRAGLFEDDRLLNAIDIP